MTATPMLICAALSDTGRVRVRNEDCVLADAARGILAVADGLGGRQAGEVASRLAIDTLVAALNDPLTDDRFTEHLIAAVEHANARVFRESCLNRRLAGMGTTLVAATLRSTHGGEQVLTVAHVGDSRLYRYHPASTAAAAELRCLTRDHSALQALLDQGVHTPAEAQRLVPRNYLTRALGVEPAVAIDHSSWTLLPGEIILLCSDGLTNMLDEPTIAAHLESGAPARALDTIASQLIETANARGGHDNISVVLAMPA